jgi:uncharacterized protein YdeI (YjbR/CyaY-like superfamily)
VISEIEDYFAKGCGRCARFDTADCSTRRWAAGLAALRRLCREAGLAEVVKWGHPCYMHAGRNVALIGALRGDFRLSFFEAALMKDPEGVLEASGPNTRHPDTIRFADAGRVDALAPVLRAYLAEAMGYAEAGLRAPKAERAVELPDELVAALDGDPALAEAFHALTPGRQRSYAINLAGARTPATRHARIARFRDRILAGKGATER